MWVRLTKAFPMVPTSWLLICAAGCLWVSYLLCAILLEAFETGVLRVGGSKSPAVEYVQAVDPNGFAMQVQWGMLLLLAIGLLGLFFGAVGLGRIYRGRVKNDAP
jgi:hypothetical protein